MADPQAARHAAAVPRQPAFAPGDVLGQQIDRSITPVDPRSVHGCQWPSLALRVEERWSEAPRYTQAQAVFADALSRWREELIPLAQAGGRRQVDVLQNLVDRVDRADGRRDTAAKSLREHAEAEPSRIRRGSHQA